MSYLVDTNVLSELRRKQPDPGVVAWFSDRPASTLYLSVLTLGEIRKGISGITDPGRQARLSDWLETELSQFFDGRILSIDQRIASCWGKLLSAAGRPLPAIDSLLAATAVSHQLVLVTRNERDFRHFPLPVVNPWQTQA